MDEGVFLKKTQKEKSSKPKKNKSKKSRFTTLIIKVF